MKNRLIICIVILFFIGLSCTKEDIPAGNETGNESGGTSPVVFNVNKTKLLQLVNQVRATGCNCGSTQMPPVAALKWNDLLAKAAYDHSVSMNANKFFSHTGLDGSNAGQRIALAGYSWSAYGENIAMGYSSEQAVMTGWLNSEGHCRNIMNGKFKEMGAGREGTYWTQDFGSR